MRRPSFRNVTFLVLALVALAGCDRDDDSALRYDLTLTQAGEAVATGRLTFDRPPRQGEDVSGRFRLSAVAGGPMDPLAITDGPFEGGFTRGDTLAIQLAEPHVADAAIQLSGRHDAGRYEGVWGTITLAGYTERGAFTAVAAD